MLGDRRRINRLLKPDRRRFPDRRSANRYTGRADFMSAGGEQMLPEDRRLKVRRFADRIRPA